MTNAMADTFCSAGQLENCNHLLSLRSITKKRRYTIVFEYYQEQLEWLWANFTIKVRLISVYQRLFNKHSWPLQYLSHHPSTPAFCWNQNAQRMSGERLHFGLLFSESFFLLSSYNPQGLLRAGYCSWEEKTTVCKRHGSRKEQLKLHSQPPCFSTSAFLIAWFLLLLMVFED